MSVTPEQLKVIAAFVAHEVNRAYCEHLGDDSQQPWSEAPQWVRDSALAGVVAHAERSDITPAQSHSLWMAHKQAEGWAYGEIKDENEKTHPCMVPYADLPEKERLKDKLFGAVVKAMLSLEAVEVET
jgi:hypothetical protein